MTRASPTNTTSGKETAYTRYLQCNHNTRHLYGELLQTMCVKFLTLSHDVQPQQQDQTLYYQYYPLFFATNKVTYVKLLSSPAAK